MNSAVHFETVSYDPRGKATKVAGQLWTKCLRPRQQCQPCYEFRTGWMRGQVVEELKGCSGRGATHKNSPEPALSAVEGPSVLRQPQANANRVPQGDGRNAPRVRNKDPIGSVATRRMR